MQKPSAAHLLESLVIAAIIFVTALASRWLGAPDQGISILWPATGLMLGYCIHQGPRPLIGAALGIVAWGWFEGFSPGGTALVAAATTVPPWCTCRLLNYWQSDHLRETNLLKTTVRLVVLGLVVQSPMAAIFGTAAMAEHPLAQSSLPLFFGVYLLVEITSGLIFVPLGWLWMPNWDKAAREKMPSIVPLLRKVLDWPTLTYVLGVGLVCLLADSQGLNTLARFLIFAAILGPMFSSVTRRPSMSTVTLAIAATMVLAMRAYLFRHEPDRLLTDGLLPAWLMTAVGAILLHLLNALSAERWRNNKRLQAKTMKSDIPGLYSARALHRFLAKLTAEQVQKPIRIIEIFVPEVLRAGELMGRTAMLELEIAAGTRLRDQAGDRFLLIVHLSTGRFAMIAPMTLSDTRLLRLVNEALQSQSFKIGGRLFQLRPTIGLIDVPAGTHSHPEAMLAALSMAQQRAFNSAERFQKFPMGSRELKEVWAELDLEESVKHALHEKRVRLMAQLIAPCQAVVESDGLHYEILARMLDEKGNVMSPGAFLPAIARAGLTREFDRLIIETTFEYLSQDKALMDRTRTCAINVTGSMICSPELPKLIQAQLLRTGFSPRKFAIEITESESIEDLEAAKANAHELSSMGLTVAVDDFGTGLATFDYLKQFKPQMLKIDGSFIRNFDDSPLDRAIVQSIVRVSNTIGATTVAEWVETEELGRKLRGLGVDFLQGYAIGKPILIEYLSALQAQPEFLKHIPTPTETTGQAFAAGKRLSDPAVA